MLTIEINLNGNKLLINCSCGAAAGFNGFSLDSNGSPARKVVAVPQKAIKNSSKNPSKLVHRATNTDPLNESAKKLERTVDAKATQTDLVSSIPKLKKVIDKFLKRNIFVPPPAKKKVANPPPVKTKVLTRAEKKLLQQQLVVVPAKKKKVVAPLAKEKVVAPPAKEKVVTPPAKKKPPVGPLVPVTSVEGSSKGKADSVPEAAQTVQLVKMDHEEIARKAQLIADAVPFRLPYSNE